MTGAEKVVGWALSHHLMNYPEADPEGRVVLSSERLLIAYQPIFFLHNSYGYINSDYVRYCSSIQYGIGILQAIQNESKSLKKSLKVIFVPFLDKFCSVFSIFLQEVF